MSFVHLHTHTHYSFLQGLGTPKKLIARAKELGMSAIALTDAGNLYGAFEFYKYAKEAGLKPIIGVEFTLASKGRGNRDKDNSTSQLVLLARNMEGYRNLIELVTASNLTGFYFKPRIDEELLRAHASGLIGLSGNHYGEIAQHVTTGRPIEFILERIRHYQSILGAEHYFLEIIEHPQVGGQTRINDTLIRLSREHGVPLVATNDTYYFTEADADTQDLLSCIGDGRSIEDPDRPSLIEGNYSLRSMEEMNELFAHAPEAVTNTLKIAEMIDLVIPYGKTLIPEFELSPERYAEYEIYLASLTPELTRLSAEEWELRRLCYEGLNTRYNFGADAPMLREFIHKVSVPAPDKKLSDMALSELIERGLSYQTARKKELMDALPPEQRVRIDRLEYELTVVDLMGFNGYFCIVADFINWAKARGIPVGPGRGSAAGAILAFLSGITDIDPLLYGLLFERFLNPARVSMPDIDVDFADVDRDQVLEYVRGKYGSDRVAQICTFGTMAARAAIKDAGKALGIPFSEMNALAALIPARPGTKLADALEESTEFKSAYQTNERYHKIIDHALKLEGTIRQLGVHACAVIIAPEPMTNYCALQHPPKDTNTTVTQLSQYPLEELGLLKMDFLGLRNLSIMKRCLKIIHEVHGVDIDLLALNFDDKRVFKVFAEGDTTGVFQFESSGMRKYLRDLAPNTFEDIIVMVSLYRPGPLAYIPTYIERKHGREKVAYPHPSLEAILRPTQGIAVYQEQIMQLVQAFAGFSLGEADILRRAIGKKKIDLLMEQKQKFITAANAQGHTTELAKYIFEDIIEPFAGYGFNKSHAACYSMISYQTAYLKAYYPTEFMTALMVSDEDDMERITMEITECAARGIEILPPDINESKKHFTYIDSEHIRFGLKAIKWLGNWPIESIQRGRSDTPYESIIELLTRTSGEVINKKSLEALTLSGALDRFGERASLLKSVGTMTAYNKEHELKTKSAQIGLFDLGGENDFWRLEFNLEPAEPMSFEERLRGEKESIGYSVSGHGLDGLAPFIARRSQWVDIAQAFLKEFEAWETTRALAYQDHATAESSESEWTPENSRDVIKEPSREVLSPVRVLENENENLDIPTPEVKKEREKQIKVRFVGLIIAVRKVQTKTGKLMGIATCEGVGINFTMVVFPKDYEVFGPLLVEDQVAIVEGYFKGNTLSGEISVVVQTLKTHAITALRTLAQEMGLFDRNHRVRGTLVRGSLTSDPGEVFILEVPRGASRQDLIDLKSYLVSIPGNQAVSIKLGGEVADTKLRVSDVALVKEWGERRWTMMK